jgi:outer membrane biosynthesis protein TonB
MKRLRLRATAAACASLSALTMGTASANDARSWHWTYVTKTAEGPPLVSQSTITIGPKLVHMSYSVPLQQRQVVIESCNADLADILDATTVRNGGTTYFLIRFKPSHDADCGSGRRPAVALPADDYAYVRAVADAVNRSTGSSGAHSAPATVAKAASPGPKPPTPAPVSTTKPTPAPTPKPTREPTSKPTPSSTGSPSAMPSSSPTPLPASSPSALPTERPSASPTPGAALQDWVENDGLFWFVRMRNISSAPITPSGEVFNCRNVGGGCGPFMHTQLEPGGTATVAVVSASSRDYAPVFEYRYTALDGARTLAGSGASAKVPPRRVARMSARELRTAQALALSQLRSPRDTSHTGPQNTPAPSMPARLLRRGSSRLAIGQTGTAVVRVMIGENGTPEEVSIVSITNRQLTAAAIETAVSSTYAPATEIGRPVAGKYIATFSFDGQDPALSDVPVWKRPPSPTPIPPAPSPEQTPAAAASALPSAPPP